MLQWSFVRDNQARALTGRQIALAIRDEVADLEKAGIKVIQISIGAHTMPVSNEQRGAFKQTIRNLNRMVFERQPYTAYESDILLMELAELLPVPD